MRLRDAALRGSRLAFAHLTGRAVPFHATLSVTQRCNHHCVYCSRPEQAGDELTTLEWCRVLDELRGLGTERVAFSGGEPLLRGDLGSIVAHARGLGLRCAMNTNGALVPRGRAVISRLQTLIISLDGDAASHDRNRGRGSHAGAVRAIESARSWGVPVKVNAVLNANNVRSLDWLLDFCEKRDLPLTLNVMRAEKSALWKGAARHRLADADVRALIDRIIAAKDDHGCILFSKSAFRLSRHWPDFGRDHLTRAEDANHPAGPLCSAGRFHCIIEPDGRLFPCIVTIGRVPALDVRKAGVAKALDLAKRHDCAACYSPCLIEINSLFALRPRVLASLGSTYLRGRIE